MYIIKITALIVFLTIATGYAAATPLCFYAKSQVKKYYKISMDAINNGERGASVNGFAELIAALELAKVKCKNKDLTFEAIINESK